MKEGKRKNILIGVLLLIVVALVAFVVLILTNTINIKLGDKSNNNVEISDNNNVGDNSSNETKSDSATNNTVECGQDALQEFKLDTFDSDKFETGGQEYLETVIKEYEETIGEEKYYLRLIKNGKINITNKSGDFSNFISNISKVVDVAELPIKGTENSVYYFLLSNGDIYYYKLQDLSVGLKEATKVDNIAKVKRIVNTITYVKGNQPPTFSIVAITDANYIVIASE